MDIFTYGIYKKDELLAALLTGRELSFETEKNS